jgi:hypothetical protein
MMAIEDILCPMGFNLAFLGGLGVLAVRLLSCPSFVSFVSFVVQLCDED